MKVERGSWMVIGWMLLIFGGWSVHAHAQEVPSKDVGKSSYFVPAFPGGKVNLYPFFGNLKYTLPLFKTTGVEPCTSVTLTYNSDTGNPSNSATCLGFGWRTDYFMRLSYDEPSESFQFTLPWGQTVGVSKNLGEYHVSIGFGMVCQIVEVAGEPHRWALLTDGGTAYNFYNDGNLRMIVGPAGNRIDLFYNGDGRPSQIVDQVPPGAAFGTGGRSTFFEYFTAANAPHPLFIDKIKKITDPAGNAYEMDYTVGASGLRLISVKFPPVVTGGQTKNPTYKFEYQNVSGSTGQMNKVIPPRAADAGGGNYGYTIEYDPVLTDRVTRIIDPVETYVTEGGTTVSAAAEWKVFYFSEQPLNDLFRVHTKVVDRRGLSTVYVFQTYPDFFNTPAPQFYSQLLSEIWDPEALANNPNYANWTTTKPGISPILTHFDHEYNLCKIRDRYGNQTDYEFKNTGLPFSWMKNLLERVKKPGPGGSQVVVEEYEYTPDIFANVWKHRTRTVAGGAWRETEHLYDAFGRIITVKHPNVTSLPDAPTQMSVTTQYFYESGGRRQLNRIINERGNSTYFQDFDPAHGLPRKEFRDGAVLGQFTETQYDIMGNVIQTRLPVGEAGNDPPGWEITLRDTHYRVKTVTDPSGVVAVTNEYDLDGNLITVTNAGDATTPAQAEQTFYDKRGFGTGGTSADGTWSQKVDVNGNVRDKRGVRFPVTGAVTTTTYDILSRISQQTVPGGSVYGVGGGGGPTMTTTYAYDVLDGSGALCDTETRLGGTEPSRITKIFYDHRRRKVQEVKPDGVTSTRCFYDEQDLLVAKETLYGGVVQSCEVTFRDERDRVFRIRTQNSPFGGTPSLVSDLVTIPNEMGTIVEKRGPLWNPGSPQAYRTVDTVDARERVTEVRDGFGVVVTRNTYGDDDLVAKIEIPDPATKSTTLVTQETRTYTARKELKEVFNRDGVRVSLTTYKVRKSLIDQVLDAGGVITETTYHPLTWRLNEVIVAKGVFESGVSMERRTQSIWTDGLLAETRVWNPSGTTPGGYTTPSVHKYFYDQADRVERTESPGLILAAEQTYYNAFGDVDTTVVGPTGTARVGDHAYNSLGQLTQTVWTGPDTATETRTYNEIGLPDSIAALTRSEASHYDNWLGTLDTQTFYVGGQPWLGGTGPTLDYTYDVSRNLMSVQDREGARHEWQYDANGRVWSIEYKPPGGTLRPVVRITFTPGGLVDTTTLHDAAGNPIAVTTNTYDGRGRKVRQQTMQSSTHTVVADLVWDYSDLNLITKIKYQHLGVESTLLYNARQEVKSESISSNGGGQTPPPYDNQIGGPPVGPESVPSGDASGTRTARLSIAARTATYVIDPAGNRTSQTIEGVTTTFEYNAASQLTIETRVSSSQTDKIVHSYDIWGNETQRTTDLNNNSSIDITEIYQYNYLNRISLYTNSATSANFQYSYWPGGDRYAKTNNGNSTSEVYIPKLGDVLADYEQVGVGTPTLKNKYVQGTTTDSKQTRIAADGTRHHFIGDAVGTVSVTLTDAGSVDQSAFKDVFGVELTAPLTGERYQGLAQRERDLESGLDYMRARMYDPRLGRFTQTDPVFSNRASEHYVYGANNPVSNVDPQGTGWLDKLRVVGSFVKSLAKDAGSAAVTVAKYAVTHNPMTPWGIYNQAKDAYDAIESTVKRAEKVYKVHKEAGEDTLSAVGLTTAMIAADKTGATAIYEGVTGVDTNRMLDTGNMNPTLTGTERAVKVIQGVTQVAGTALAVAGGKQMLSDMKTGRTLGGVQAEMEGAAAKAETPVANKSSMPPAAAETPAGPPKPAIDPASKTYDRGSFRKGVREQVWEDAKKASPDGKVRDPLTGREISFDEPWDMGHLPGQEFRRHRIDAAKRGVGRKEFLDEYNDPKKYRPELPESNRSHKGEKPGTN